MKKKIFVCLGFLLCFCVGFVCGMYAQERVVHGNNDDNHGAVVTAIGKFISDKNAARLAAAADAKQYIATNIGGDACPDGSAPDKNGCCVGEEYLYLNDNNEWACCPETGDCFPPMVAAD